MSFKETDEQLAENVASISFDLKAIVARKKLPLDYVYNGSQGIRGGGRIR